ncbi:FAD binding domain-containing protein [Crucibulum laeve]|uniref:FAD binding domain-containing protein n=1 Tax=Crucibulum laeve TaxID=68775 RepID=A0A5C3M775_9AGAR|nr:FAD binding domain-containing protein [Crucibulum laeve]
MSIEPILIVGAGPAGLVLALSLLQNGVAVRIIDKAKTYRIGERGAGIMPRTLEVHNILGTLTDVYNKSKPLPFTRVYGPPEGTEVLRTFNMSPYIEPTGPSPYKNPVMLGQHHHEAILRSHLEKYGCHVEIATELHSFEQHESHVTAHLVHDDGGKQVTETANFPWMIGTDGARSTVRKQLSLSFLGETRTGENIVVGDIYVKEGLDSEFCHSWGDPAVKMAFLRPTGQGDNIFAFLIFGKEMDYDKVATCREEVVKAFYEISSRKDIIFGDLTWISNYRPNMRMVDKFREGRVFVAGDAAHCHTPAGGQGMNSSVQDSFNLGWKLALVHKGLAPSSLLDSYGTERLPIIAEMLNKSTLLFNQTIKPGATLGDSSWRRDGDLHQLGVNYRSSPIVIDEAAGESVASAAYNSGSETEARAGDRAPEAAGLVDITNEDKSTSLFKIFGASYHTVLVFSGTVEEHAALAEVSKKLPQDTVRSILIVSTADVVTTSTQHKELFNQVLLDPQATAFSTYWTPSDSLGVIVVRPDGVIGARVRDVSGLQKYFSGIFLEA